MQTPSDKYDKDASLVSNYSIHIPSISEIEIPSPINIKNMPEIIRKLDYVIDNTRMELLMNSNVAYLLTLCLDCVVTEMNQDLSVMIGRLMLKLANKDPNALVMMLGKTNELGDFKGHNTAYAWVKELYLATFGIQNNSAIIAINMVLSLLLNKAGDSLLPLLMKDGEDGREKGKNALFILAQAINQSAQQPLNQSSTVLIATLLKSCMLQNPSEFFNKLPIELNTSLLRGSSVLSILVGSLKYLVKDNPLGVNLITNLLHPIIQTEKGMAFFKVAGNGFFKGASLVDTILASIVSAAYINANDDVMGQLMSVLQDLLTSLPTETIEALTRDVYKESGTGTNGVALLVQALVASTTHNIDISPIVNQLDRLIDSGSAKVVKAFVDPIFLETEGRITVSPLQRLIGIANNRNVPNKDARRVKDLIIKLSSLNNSLSSESASVFDPNSLR